MRIAQLAPLLEAVPPNGYGGIELVVSTLTEELVKRGHEVTLFASGDSKTSARLCPVVDNALRQNQAVRKHLHPVYDLRSLLWLESIQDEFDLIHNHMGWQALPALSRLTAQSITTNHNLIEDETAPIYLAHRAMPFVAISKAYEQLNYADQLNYVDIIYNGIDINLYQFDPGSQRNYLLFLGRICKEKGTADAITLSLSLNIPLKIAGKVDAVDRDYFKNEIEPFLHHPLIEYVGEVNHTQKVALLQGAIALAYPIAFEEPFGLVMIESMSCGVPVLALERGSVKEVLVDGQTAIVAHNIDELASRFSQIKSLSRENCRAHVAQLFTAERMTDRYELAYLRLVSDNKKPAQKCFAGISVLDQSEQLRRVNVLSDLTDAISMRPIDENT